MHCQGCGIPAAELDAFCHRCGTPLRAGVRPHHASVSSFERHDGRLFRLGRLLAAHTRIVVIAVLIGGVGLLAVSGGLDETEVPEDTSSPGYAMVRDLRREGAITEFSSVEPEEGWDTEYSIDGGSIRFRGSGSNSEMETDVTDDAVSRAVEARARAAGFTRR